METTDSRFELPRDESPFSLPPGWAGGTVCSTGGGVYVRKWVYETDEERVEVSYPPSFEGVQAERYVRDGDQWERDGFVAMRDADEQTTTECREIARELMRELRC